jgi:hypothetical protein
MLTKYSKFAGVEDKMRVARAAAHAPGADPADIYARSTVNADSADAPADEAAQSAAPAPRKTMRVRKAS